MFLGQYSHNLDAKGRLAVPAKFRNELKKAVVTQGFDNCLVLYPKKSWEQLAPKVAAMPINKENSRAVSRFILSSAMDVEVDGQGRIVLPEYLRKFAGISKKVIIAGLYDRLEIWDEDQWNKMKKETEKNSNSIAEQLSDLAVNIE
jgi:MraZ protein